MDMNAYFASVEQAANPALRGKPVIVCGEGRTIVTAVSYEARKYGVKTGMSLPEAKTLCPCLICVVGDVHKYVDTTFKIQKILLEFTDQVEPFSIDECFADITHLCKQEYDAKIVSKKIKERLKDELGLKCSIGIGPNKVVAKLASKMQKPDGLVEIREQDIPQIFAELPIEKLQGVGVGNKLSSKLTSLGIETAKELGDASISMLSAHFGIVGYHLKRIGQGQDDSPVKKYNEQEQIKSFGHSHTLPQDTKEIDTIKSYLFMLSEKVGKRLRQANFMGRTISLFVRYGDFTGFSKQHSLKYCIKTGYEIYSAANAILKKIMPLKKAVRLLGVSISSLTPDHKQQFLLEEMEKQDKLTRTVDTLNKKYGDFTVKPSSLLIAEHFGIQERCGLIGRYFFKKR